MEKKKKKKLNCFKIINNFVINKGEPTYFLLVGTFTFGLGDNKAKYYLAIWYTRRRKKILLINLPCQTFQVVSSFITASAESAFPISSLFSSQSILRLFLITSLTFSGCVISFHQTQRNLFHPHVSLIELSLGIL